MNGFVIVKAIAKCVASIGVSTVVSNAIQFTTPANLGTSKKVLVVVGDLVLSSIASDMACKYVENAVREIFEKKNADVIDAPKKAE